MHLHTKDFMVYALEIGALQLLAEPRMLKSGRLSPYFFNSGAFYTGGRLKKLSEAYYDAMVARRLSCQVIFGPSYKGSAIAVALALNYGDDMQYAYDRKEAKTHGEGGIIIGAPLKGKQVLLVDDVMTSGESLGQAFSLVKLQGGTPIGCVIAFDRQERGIESSLSAVKEFEQEYGIPVIAAANFANLIDYLQVIKSPFFEKLLAYQKEYGAMRT